MENHGLAIFSDIDRQQNMTDLLKIIMIWLNLK